MLLPKYKKIEIDPLLADRLLAAANAAADAASKATMAHFRKAMAVENKEAPGRFDPVTVADRNAEQAIKKVVLDTFPEHGFFGEESEKSIKENQPLWVVDPIDGTRAFITGMPLWGTLIAVYDGADVVLGVLEQPFLGERFVGTTFNHEGVQASSSLLKAGQKQIIQTRRNVALADAIVQTTSPEMFELEGEKAVFEKLKASVSMVRYGGDCYCYALLAMGFVDIVIETSLQPYDIAALIPIIEGAGGVITSWDGGSAANGGAVIACGSEALHAQVMNSGLLAQG